MSRVSKTVVGYCPILNRQEKIDVYFLELPILGAQNPGYKKEGSSSCEHAKDEKCPLSSKFGSEGCPLIHSATYE